MTKVLVKVGDDEQQVAVAHPRCPTVDCFKPGQNFRIDGGSVVAAGYECTTRTAHGCPTRKARSESYVLVPVWRKV